MSRERAIRLRQLPTAALAPDDVTAIRFLLDAAFADGDGFDEEDWRHALGGVHFVLDVDGEVVSHAAVVERELHLGTTPLRTGYVEAVATAPRWQGRGFGTRVMEAVNAHIDEQFELGALGTGRFAFYERLGWVAWPGPTFVRTSNGPARTPDDDGIVLVLRTRTSPPLDLEAPISCDWRTGDAW